MSNDIIVKEYKVLCTRFLNVSYYIFKRPTEKIFWRLCAIKKHPRHKVVLSAIYFCTIINFQYWPTNLEKIPRFATNDRILHLAHYHTVTSYAYFVISTKYEEESLCKRTDLAPLIFNSQSQLLRNDSVLLSVITSLCSIKLSELSVWLCFYCSSS